MAEIIVDCLSSDIKLLKYDKIIENNALNLIAIKGGTDSGQIAIFCKEKKTVEVKPENLYSETGNVFSSDNFDIYFEKYIFVDKNWQKNGFTVGWYPDALIPAYSQFFREENITGDGNVCVWIDARVPLGQPAGLYTGNIVVCGRKVKVSIEVCDAKLSEKPTQKTLFTLNGEHMAHYEGDASKDLVKAYNECLIRHRVCSAIPDSDGKSSWADDFFDFVKNGATAVNIPSPYASENHNKYGNIPDYDDLILKLNELKEKSLETEIDLFSYATYYDWMIDEPFFCRFPDGKVEYHIQKFEELLQKFVDGCKNDKRLETEFGEKLLESAKNLTHIVTDYRDRPNVAMLPVKKENGRRYVYDNKTTLCPKFDGFDSEKQRNLYSGQKELWWYGCNTPNAPYPGYHIDDAGYSARAVGWMMARYGITGNLYWCVNFFKECNTTGTMIFFDDPYSIAHMGMGANGDGAILYPGKPYGIFGPVCSIRLKSIRSGYEEYEIIKVMRKEYQKRGFDFDALFSLLTSEFMDGVKIDPYFTGFVERRNTLIRLYELLEYYGITVSFEKRGAQKVFSIKAERTKFDCFADGKTAIENGDEKLLFINKGQKEINILIVTDKYIPLKFVLKGRKRIITHENLYLKNVVSVEEGSLTINRDDIRREINVVLTENKPKVQIELFKIAKRYNSADILLRATKNASYEIISNGKSLSCGKVVTGWNRIKLTGEGENVSSFSIEFSEGGEYGLGEIYLTK